MYALIVQIYCLSEYLPKVTATQVYVRDPLLASSPYNWTHKDIRQMSDSILFVGELAIMFQKHLTYKSWS